MFKNISIALVGLALVASVPMAQAATVTITQVAAPGGGFTWPGSDCSGTFGQSFANCAYNRSPIIAKFNTPFAFNNSQQTELNTAAFPGLQASWFTLTGTTWKYDPQGAGPGITAFVAKAGNDFFVYTMNGGAYFGGSQVFTFGTPLNNQGLPRELSHISFYDSTTRPNPDASVVPVPAALPLMLSGLVGFGLLVRRRRNAV